MSRVSIEPAILHWAVNRSGRDLASLEERFNKLENWLSGELQPTLKQLETFAKATHTPLGFLFLKTPPEEKLPMPDFRTLANQQVSRPSPDLLDTIHEMQRRQDWMRDYLLELGAEPLPFVGSAKREGSTAKVASEIRSTLRLSEDWAEAYSNWEQALDGLKGAIQNTGILVFANGVVGSNNRRVLDPEEFRGFVLCDPLAPLIFINNQDAKSARMFTLAHELAHLWLGEDALFNFNMLEPATVELEVHCNAIAAEFLLPAAKLREQWPPRPGDDPFGQLARRFKVSSLVVARRCLDLELISREDYLTHHQESQQRYMQKPKGNGGNYYATAGSRLDPNFVTAVAQARRSGKLLPTHAQRLMGMKGKTLDRFLRNETKGGKVR